MKKLIGLFVGILLATSTLAQEKVEIPKDILDNIVDELVVKDGLVYKVQLQDSVIQVYKEQEDKNRRLIEIYRLNEVEYRKIVDNQSDQLKIADAEGKDKEKRIRRLNFSNITLKILVSAETIALVVLLILIVV